MCVFSDYRRRGDFFFRSLFFPPRFAPSVVIVVIADERKKTAFSFASPVSTSHFPASFDPLTDHRHVRNAEDPQQEAELARAAFDAIPNDVIVSNCDRHLLVEPESVLSPTERERRSSNNLRWA